MSHPRELGVVVSFIFCLTISASAAADPGASSPTGLDGAAGSRASSLPTKAETRPTASAPASAPAADVIHSLRTQEEYRAAVDAQQEKTRPLKYEVKRQEYAGEEGYTLAYTLNRPPREAPGKTYPLVILYGDVTGANVLALPEYQAKYPCFVLEVQPSKDLPGKRPDWKQIVAKMTKGLVDGLAKEFRIDPARIYASGHSASGGMAWATALEYPDLLAAVAPSAATCDISLAPVIVEHHVAVWVFMGAKDFAVGIDNPRGARAMVDAIVKAGGRVKYTEYDNLGHAYACMVEPDLSALLDWMFSQQRKGGK